MMKLLHGETNFDMKIIVRKWEKFLPEWEFRGKQRIRISEQKKVAPPKNTSKQQQLDVLPFFIAFIVNDELVACTQYYKLVFVKEMEQKKIAQHIKNYFDQIKSLIPIKNYTVDFALSPDFCTSEFF